MLYFLEATFYFILSLGASIVGTISGVGSGIMVKPAIELATPMDPFYVSLLSGLSVFIMSVVAFLRQRKVIFPKRYATSMAEGAELNVTDSGEEKPKEEGIKFKIALPLAIGSAFGGIFGNVLFGFIREHIAVAQGIGMIAVMTILLAHQILEHKIKPLKLKEKAPLFLTLGLVLGVIAAFLGIGGGPLNLSALAFFAGMPIKLAALYSIFIIFFAQGTNLIHWAIPLPWMPETWPVTSIRFNWATSAAWNAAVIIPLVVLGSVLGALIGARLYKKVSNNNIKKIYCAVLIAVLGISIFNLIMVFNAMSG